MKTPYEVLGLSRESNDREIQDAYQRIVDRYRPENHPDNPLAHLAQEKLDEAARALAEIEAERSPQKSNPSQFLDIRRLINNNRVSEAQELLEGTPMERRDAEWYFLKGTVQLSRGWLEEAYENFTRATQLNPQNSEYRAALSQLQWQRQTGTPEGGYPNTKNMGGAECGLCNLCTTLCCANMCCNCMMGC